MLINRCPKRNVTRINGAKGSFKNVGIAKNQQRCVKDTRLLDKKKKEDKKGVKSSKERKAIDLNWVRGHFR